MMKYDEGVLKGNPYVGCEFGKELQGHGVTGGVTDRGGGGVLP